MDGWTAWSGLRRSQAPTDGAEEGRKQSGLGLLHSFLLVAGMGAGAASKGRSGDTAGSAIFDRSTIGQRRRGQGKGSTET